MSFTQKIIKHHLLIEAPPRRQTRYSVHFYYIVTAPVNSHCVMMLLRYIICHIFFKLNVFFCQTYITPLDFKCRLQKLSKVKRRSKNITQVQNEFVSVNYNENVIESFEFDDSLISSANILTFVYTEWVSIF